MSKLKIGIIGGTGFVDGSFFGQESILDIDTPFGKPSDKLVCGKISGVDVVFLSRHSKDYSLNGSNINYRANIFALKKAHCTHIIASNACGSLDGNYQPGDLVVLHQIFDDTKSRASSFYDGTSEEFKGVHHWHCADPFDEKLRQVIIKCLEGTSMRHHTKGAIAVIEGPRYSTRAESWFYKKAADCQIIGMTSAPEAFLAMEIGIPYASIGLVTDMDSWDETIEPVTDEMVIRTFTKFAGNMKILLVKIIESLSQTSI